MKNLLKPLNISVTIILIAIFFYKISDAPLFSYDEAWYGDVARNLVITKNPLKLIYNGGIFIDHPPLGFILMSIPAIFFGSNEFSVRFLSTLLGMGSVILVYLVGKKMNNKITGIIASLVLLSSMWFMFRARSGNLDAPLVFFQILSIYFLLKKGEKNLFFGSISFACSFLIKALVGIGILPAVLFLIYSNHRKYSFKIYLKTISIALIILLPWFVYNQHLNSNFLNHHFITIGTRGEINSFALDSIISASNYLAIGIGKWYKIFLTSGIISIVTFIFNKKQRKNILVLFLWLVGFSMFFISDKTEIWHLIPLYPAVSLLIGLLPNYLLKLLPIKFIVIEYLFLILFFLLAFFQFKQFSNLIYTNHNNYGDEKDISIKAGKYENINVVETFFPTVIYYSKKNIITLNLSEAPYHTMVEKIKEKSNEVFIVNNGLLNRLNEDLIDNKILEKNNSYLIISFSEYY
ncbi:MAG: glycosyltransferase family 39 protein [Pseudomonadales bacterium]|nr:glycosyltransferase family 39 protein [Pseudomonadales bacterium]